MEIKKFTRELVAALRSSGIDFKKQGTLKKARDAFAELSKKHIQISILWITSEKNVNFQLLFVSENPSFKDLEVYKLSRLLSIEIYQASKSFPKEEIYSLTDQIRRSSRSVGAQIAEAWAKRRYKKHFISKLTDADGEQQETQHWIETALDCCYLSETCGMDWLERYASVGRMLNSMINKADSFCSQYKGDR